MKQVTISEKNYHRLRTTGSQPARLYGLAKIHKNGTPLRPVLSIPGSSFENLDKFLSPLFEKCQVQILRLTLERCQSSTRDYQIGEDELVVSLYVKSFYINVPAQEAIEVALIELYSSGEVPEIPRSAMKSLLGLAVTDFLL